MGLNDWCFCVCFTTLHPSHGLALGSSDLLAASHHALAAVLPLPPPGPGPLYLHGALVARP